MTEFRQPGVWLYKTEEPPIVAFSTEHLRRLAKLSTEEVTQVLAPVTDPRDRLDIVRGIQDIRIGERAEQDFEDQVEINRERKRAKKEGDRRDAEELAAYLTSEEGQAEAVARIESQIIDLEDLEDPEPLVDGFLYRDTLVRTFGPPKSLKSFVTLDMAASVSLGLPWQGAETTQTTVLYIVAEGVRGVKKRRNAWNEHHNAEMKVIFFPKPIQIGDREQMHDLIAFCRLKQVGYVVFDTQARCTVGVEENDNTEMGEIVASLDILKQETGACVHLVHHSPAADPSKARGASAFDGAVDAEFYTKREAKTDSVKLVTKFQKDTEEAEDVEMDAVKVGASLILTGGNGGAGGSGRIDASKLPDVSDSLLTYLNVLTDYSATGASQRELTRESGREQSTVSRNVNKLIEKGVVELKGSKVILTDLGWSVVRHRSRHAEPPQGAQWTPETLA